MSSTGRKDQGQGPRIAAGGLAIRQSGGSRGPVVLCHGNSLAAQVYAGQLQSSLGDAFRLVALDLPGHGDSPDDPLRYNPTALVEAIVGVVEDLGLQRPVLVGHSLGGHLMAQATARLKAVRGLFVFGTPLLSSLEDLSEAFLPHPAAGLLFQADLDDAATAALVAMLAPARPENAQRVERLLRRTDPRFRSGLGAALQKGYPDEVALVRELKAPVALVTGENDALVNRAYLERLSLPNLWRGEVQIIDGVGHLPQLDAIERFNALLGTFLEEVD